MLFFIKIGKVSKRKIKNLNLNNNWKTYLHFVLTIHSVLVDLPEYLFFVALFKKIHNVRSSFGSITKT